MYKINIDAGVVTGEKVVGIGVVIRDSNGQFIVGLSNKIHGISSVVTAEALAARRVLFR